MAHTSHVLIVTTKPELFANWPADMVHVVEDMASAKLRLQEFTYRLVFSDKGKLGPKSADNGFRLAQFVASTHPQTATYVIADQVQSFDRQWAETQGAAGLIRRDPGVILSTMRANGISI